ncbi:MAG: acetyl-CoA synthetase [Chloroflexi bacterium]|nr:acetyl-CoA synthetase [Chloroflexota bacterium]
MADIIASARAEGRLLLTEVESKELLRKAGIRVARAHLARKPKDAVELAEKLGYPVVMKIVSTEIAHKSDVGGVVVGVKNASGVRQAFKEITERVKKAAPKASVDGIAVQTMAKPGTEVIVGATTDPQFGPVMMFGLGGVFVEVLKDVSFRIVPLEERDAQQMVREINGLPLLQGARGSAKADLGALEKMLMQVSDFMTAHPEVAELDLTPVFAYSKGAIAVDARIVLAAPVEAAAPAEVA